MDEQEAREILKRGYAEGFLAPFCNHKDLLGDVLAYDADVEEAARLCGVFKAVASAAGQAVLILEHDAALCPTRQCNHNNCCMKKDGPEL